jgi:hypothetical protein
MSLVEDVRAAFRAKGLTFVSMTESKEDPENTTLTYTDGSGKTVQKEVKIRLEELENTVAVLDGMDPADLANFLLDDSTSKAD